MHVAVHELSARVVQHTSGCLKCSYDSVTEKYFLMGDFSWYTCTQSRPKLNFFECIHLVHSSMETDYSDSDSDSLLSSLPAWLRFCSF